ncbi:LITAF-like zinc ribbon domain-containing protein [Aspergillus foveolatus]|uniref:LITAF-like zinc ribbon domain-containing protein n=1 Tax=Aspergillus foveolatus TaxID=210207 RepID=UPI003CCE1C40
MSEKANYDANGQGPPGYAPPGPAQPAPVAQGTQPPHHPTEPNPEIQVQTMPPQQYTTGYPAGQQQPQNAAPQMYPPQPYVQGQPQPSQYPTAFPLHALQRTPQVVDCPACGQREMTRTEAVNGNSTHAWAAVLCCCACIGCIPYFVAAFKNVDHHCGKCGQLLATYHGSGHVVVHSQGGQVQQAPK